MTNDESRRKNESPISTRPRLDPANIEVIDDAMVEALRAKTPAERIAMISDMHDTAELLIAAGIRQMHRTWTDEQVHREMSPTSGTRFCSVLTSG